MGGQQTRPLYNICLAHFLKTNLWKYADISVKRRQKAEAFWDRQLQNHTNEGKGKQKKKERGGRKEEKRKSNFFYNGYFIDISVGGKHCWTQKVHLAVRFSKIRLD